MSCTNNICNCGPYQYHNSTSLTCHNQTLNNTKCSVSYNCRYDLGLECRDGLCQCFVETPYWSIYHNKCIKQKTYSETTCSYLDDCVMSKSLVCNLDASYSTTPCNCPATFSVGMCDCYRRPGNESYWDGSVCVPAKAKDMTCTDFSRSYECQYLTTGTICNSSTGSFICECAPLKYFNRTFCVDQVLHNVNCPLGTECRNDLGLSCQSTVCKCNETNQYWSTYVTPNRCINYKNYTDACNSDLECHPANSLKCKSASDTVCNCPTASITGYCDCVREINNESYWDITKCVPALAKSATCAGASYSYTCKRLSENTVCNSSTGSFKCECQVLKYFNSTYCVDQVLVNVACPLAIECRADLGLICQSGTCKCDPSYQFWSTSVTPNRCINYKTYTESCTSNGDCDAKLGLICKTGSNGACNCPTISVSNYCDCTRELNNETYWNGTKCLPAGNYNAPCTVGKDYQCQTYTQNTTCISGNCLCGTDGQLKSTTNKCAYCESGWAYMFDTCYRVGNETTSNTESTGIGPKVDAGCSKSGAQMGKLLNDTVLSFLISKQVPPREYWIDAVFVTGSTYQSRDSTVTVPSAKWCSSFPDGSALAYWSSASNCYKTAANSAGITLYYFCQYTPS